MTVSHRFTLLALAVCLPFRMVAANADVLNWQTNEVIPGTEGITPGPGVDFWALNNDGFDLSFADFGGFDLTGGVFDNANLSNALFDGSNLQGASLEYTDLSDADFDDANLERANARGSDLSRATFDAAVIRGVDFYKANLSREQLYSTESYREKDLRGIEVSSSMQDWDLAGQDLSFADFWAASLGGADLTGAIITGTHFPWRSIYPFGELTQEDADEFNDLKFSATQLYSTASYQEKNLQRVTFTASDLRDWDFREQDLRFADLGQSRLNRADFSNADLRNTLFADFGGKSDQANGLQSAIFNSGTIYNQWTSFPKDFDPEEAGLTFVSSPLGDFDLNDVLDVVDIDLLATLLDRGEITCPCKGDTFLPFSLDGKLGIGADDFHFWVKELKNTYFGDANLDGEFNSADLVQVFQANEYEDDLDNNSGWADGDWNADREFTSSDLVAAFQDGGYGHGPRIAARMVPEPSHTMILCIGFFIVLRNRLRPLSTI